MGSEFLKITNISQVEEILEDLFKRLYSKPKTECIPLEQAQFRVLSEDIHAPIDLPPFDRSLMDGFAVKAQDTFAATEENPVKLKLLEKIFAGYVPRKEVKEGFCSEISTGAPIPPGADGVVMVEYSEKRNEDIYIFKSSLPGQYIASKGSDVGRGQLVLKKGFILTPDKIGVLSALGYSRVNVQSKMKVAIISTGNELISPAENLEYGKIYDVNSLTLSTALRSYGAHTIFRGIIADDYDALQTAIKDSLKVSDLIITSGGTSAGTGDVLRQVLDDMGEVMVHGISMKPGKPTIIGVINEKLLLGLPGNPGAALIVLDVLLAPILKRFAGLGKSPKNTNKIRLPLFTRFHSAKGRMQYVLVKIEKGFVYPILKDSGSITALSEAHGYINIPKNVEIIPEGQKVEVVLFDERGIILS